MIFTDFARDPRIAELNWDRFLASALAAGETVGKLAMVECLLGSNPILAMSLVKPPLATMESDIGRGVRL